MDLQKWKDGLALAGAIALGLPALLSALKAFFKLIPGEQPDKAIEMLEGVSEKVVAMISKIYPKAPQ